MIIDSHAHAFPSMSGSSGHNSLSAHMRYAQHMLRMHHQPVHRLADNSVLTSQTLFDGFNPSLEGLTEVDFRGGNYGKFVWTVDGIDHSIQYLPPTLVELSASPELMVAQMDYVGVDRAVLQNGHSYGRLNEYLSDAVHKFPDRFWALAMVDEWRVDEPNQTRELDHAVNELGLHALWFMSASLKQHGRTEMLDDPIFYPFWDHVRKLRIPVYWFITSAEPSIEAYLAEVAAFDRWLARYPDVPCVFTHGVPPSKFINGTDIVIPSEVWETLSSPNVITEIVIPISQGAMWDYPYIEAQPLIREYYERLGPDKLAWGSDMPNVERHCTYKQSLDYLRLHANFIPTKDMAKICGGNVAKLFNLVL